MGWEKKDRRWLPPPDASNQPYVPCYTVTPGRVHQLVAVSHSPCSVIAHYTNGRSRICLAPEKTRKEGADTCPGCADRNACRRWYAYLLAVAPRTPGAPLENAMSLCLLSFTASTWNNLPDSWREGDYGSWAYHVLEAKRAGASCRSRLIITVQERTVTPKIDFESRIRSDEHLEAIVERLLGKD